MRDIVSVNLPGREYDIHIGPGLLQDAGTLIAPLLSQPRVRVITDETVGALHLETLRSGLASSGIEMRSLVLKPGEGTKNWENLSTCVEWLLDQKVERRDVIVAFLRRGVRFVQIPTSLLAQVDSSVGGKTGINTRHGKNLVGSFHQPSLVLADIDVLGTLTPRDFLAGCGEVVKYGLLGDAEFFEWLEGNGPKMAAGDVAARVHAVRRSVEMKAEIVTRDETEQGDRALLNLGHTFCHALEAATGYSDRLLHGEGVAIGCALAFEVSSKMGLCSQEDPSRLRAFLKDMGMKTDLSDIDGDLPSAEALVELMGQDKKVLDGQLRFILTRGIGTSFVTSDVSRDLIVEVLEDALKP